MPITYNEYVHIFNGRLVDGIAHFEYEPLLNFPSGSIRGSIIMDLQDSPVPVCDFLTEGSAVFLFNKLQGLAPVSGRYDLNSGILMFSWDKYPAVHCLAVNYMWGDYFGAPARVAKVSKPAERVWAREGF